MTANRIMLAMIPPLIMIVTALVLPGIEQWLAAFGKTEQAKLTLARIGLALPYVSGAAIGLMSLFATNGSANIKTAGWSVFAGCTAIIGIAVIREGYRLWALSDAVAAGRSVLSYADPATMTGGAVAMFAGLFAIRVAMLGNAAFARSEPKRIRGRRALHGEAEWMKLQDAEKLFSEAGGIVIGEKYRVDRDSTAALAFRADRPETWGAGGKAPLLCFDGSFGSSHGIVFAGSGGFKTTSVTIPTALKWGGPLIVLDPSNEVAPMVSAHRGRAGRDIHILDPRNSEVGLNVLDWIGRHGNTKEEDIAAVASWIMSDSGRATGVRDDFFRSSGLQLLTAMIADVCLSGHTRPEHQTLRQVRQNLAEPEPKLRERLQTIHANSKSDFVKENVAAFVNMTPETFSGVYANAVKETHWLSYPNYAALVSGSSFTTEDIAGGSVDVFLNIDLKTLETHSGLARVIIGSFLNAIYNRDGAMKGRALFLLDEVARLGYMRILETARDAGRKYGITLTMIYQSIGQLRETFGGRDAASKWFESASWISFAAINDPETAEYISRRCGTTTVEIDQVSRSFQASGSSRTRSKQLAARPLIQPHEVLRMRADEQVVFTAGNPPLRCGRAIWFRREDMKSCLAENRFHRFAAGMPAPDAYSNSAEVER
ncbi:MULTISPECIES: Ti-type conjugative transfer system protein TraG [unclassified Agrobacterium]|uniref:Ti-type conjugative transfer system protein TraG n=1 Tax=unclassified Agrobacterium TaxID=2632611 RepID=UPI00244B8702|nr:MULTISPECIES: Ti-type conjugative transfer system protein TraG [unclassified Agrobacterium]MDH0615612.1 Ti-type conjugative transfer system protein TraG [Agrobacterium sp. GD03872]MDH0698751.1 Ti-type conjugative transfer system protein TraG [Agrobacterium sp. GD03871]MDH1061424.1 Ti-type conjugative transfer system protein TraG [Agrobacterium sp. GD03992]MDH2212641.1 Ti-type conjugative transfer system protein TraG [Agrobacterium sp. GD03643]MDH2221006.1 Ti-type conjugative transfer system